MTALNRDCGHPNHGADDHDCSPFVTDRTLTRGDVTELRPDFPPKVISKWLSGGAISTDRLVAELRMYADYFDQIPQPNCGNRFGMGSEIVCTAHDDGYHNAPEFFTGWGDPPDRIRRWCWRCLRHRWFERKAIDAEPGWLWIYLDKRCHTGGPS